MKETALLDYGGRVNKGVSYQIKEDNSGILLKSFEWDGSKMKVIEIIQYVPWNFGSVNPGAGQLGIYEVVDHSGKKHFVLIKDYRATEGDWRIMLINIKDTEREIKNDLALDGTYGFSFMDYLF